MDAGRLLPVRGPEQKLTVSASIQGSLFKFQESWNWNQSPRLPKRGTIGGFSSAARLRMIKEIAVIDWASTGKCLFITFTYPDELGIRTYQERTRDRTLVLRRIEKYLGRQVATLWRLEWKERKSGALVGQVMPHLHMLVFGVEYLPWEDIRDWWRATLQHVGPLHTYVQACTDGKLAAKYAAKYAAKDASSSLVNAAYLDGVLGRAWGLTRAKLIPRAALTIYRDLPPAVERALRVLGSEMRHHHAPECQGSYCVIGDAVGGLVKIILASALPEKAMTHI
jgi:hypothetical protein